MSEGTKEEESKNQDDLARVEKDLEEVGFIKPPDGGYGWIVVFASFIANLVVDGIIFTSGDALLSLWQQDFATSDTASALTLSILSGTYLLVGPIASALANMYGCRAIVITGSLLSFFGFICSTIAPQIAFLYFSFGLVGGVGFGLIYLPAIVVIAQYFAENRSLATGLAVCGSGIGTTLFSTINPLVMDIVGENWRLFLIYLAGCSLICIFSAIVYVPMEPSSEQIEEVSIPVLGYCHVHSLDFPRDLSLFDRYNLQGVFLMLNSRDYALIIAVKSGVWSHHNIVQAVARESVRDLNRPLSRMDVFYSGSTTNLRKRSSPSIVVTGTVENDKMSSTCKDFWKNMNGFQTLNTLLDTSLLSSPSFIILAVSGFLTLSCFYVPYNYLGQHLSKIRNLTQAQKSLPISLLGIINIAARIVCGQYNDFFGWIADRPQVDALLVSNVAVMVAGIATCMVPFFTEFWHFIVFCIPFATGVACFAALRSVICVDLFGLAKLSNAFGILLTFMGFGAIVGSPLAAFMKDLTGNFDVSFYIMGCLMTTSGAMCMPLRKIRILEEKRDANHATELTKLN
ncbi:unnamed protein product [Angiostrongylus costaricensis]|uniref:MFS domain-containing protein n=1 Tax=Angiostrongylus costaricensis TaxID=334426 RepID=A0A0R3PRQ0_ANGCS|nr:unnamed protein product [Angiostrongylus costaricensis]